MKRTTYFAEMAQPTLYPSQFRFRLQQALKRGETYPMDSLDFILADIEKPKEYTRAAQMCTTDLSGRYLDFLSLAAPLGLEGFHADRLHQLFDRINKCRNTTYRIDSTDTYGRMTTAFANYFFYCADQRAYGALLEAAESYRGAAPVDQYMEADHYESLAHVYAVTHEKAVLDSARGVVLPESLHGLHSHGTLNALRGLQLMTMYSGDISFSDKVEPYRREILSRYEYPDGCVSEYFPSSMLNEGCTISDWIMTNLNAGFIYGDDEAYAIAENSLLNAMFFNQTIYGGFGHKGLSPNGYHSGDYTEAWWCCLSNCGRCMTDLASHIVTRRPDGIHVNFLIPGKYVLNGAEVEIITGYPTRADAIITVSGSGEVHIRIPGCIVRPGLTCETNADGVRTFRLSGKMGYHTVSFERENARMLCYGPLILAPSINRLRPRDEYRKQAILTGIFNDVKWYDGAGLENIEKSRCSLVLPKADEDGLIPLKYAGHGGWIYYDEGTNNRDYIDPVSAYVTLQYAGGVRCDMRFYPLSYFSRANVSGEIPFLFTRDDAQ